MFAGSALKEREEGGHYASLDLGCELTSSLVLFCFHELLVKGILIGAQDFERINVLVILLFLIFYKVVCSRF